MKILKIKQPDASSGDNGLLSALNHVQREAAGIINGPILILAGAGSGKTRVLTYRIAYLIEKGVTPYSILALTFTNKAAREMKDRIGKLVGEERARQIWAGTFHAIFARILRREAEHLGFTSSFTIYDTDDTLSIIRNVMQVLGISQQQYAPQAVRARISTAKNQMLSWQEFQHSADSIFDKQTGLIYQEYEKRLKQNNAMDFDDLLLNVIRLFEIKPDVLERYHEHFKYILVDEYQDTNRAQYLAINLLAKKYRNLCVVGDDAQSIYRWRGADIRNILDFQRDYPDAKVLRLEQNYRSTKTILTAANDVIGNNKNQLKKELWTANDDGEPIVLMQCRDDREEAEKVVQIIQKERQEHRRELREFAVLYRTNAQSQAIEDALRRQNYAYSIVGGVSFYKRKEVKDTLAYLKLVVNPHDSESFLRIVNEPARGLGKTSLEAIVQYAREHSLPVFEAFRQAEAISTIQKRAQNAARDFADFIGKFIALKDSLPPDELAKMLIEASGLLRMYKEEGTEEALDRWNNIERVLSHITEYTQREEEPSLEHYLQEVALVDDVEQTNLSPNHVTLMTLHAAKGLEFPVVFIAGMEQGLFPLGKAETEPEEMEEERRLFYVGITRAEQKVYLSYAERRYRFGELTFPTPSRFLEEINPSLVKRVGIGVAQHKVTQPGSYTKVPFQPKPAPKREHYFEDIPVQENYSQIPSADQPKLRIGMRVQHEIFGEGKIVALSGQGNNAKAIVAFPGIGQKHLLLKFAKLKVVG